jgi:hypothetical protein
MSDIHDVIDILSALRQLVVAESALAGFIPAADALLEHARTIADGSRVILLFDGSNGVPINKQVPRIPTRELAIALRATFDQLPTIAGDDDPQLKMAYAALLRNAHASILSAIFQQYPEVLPTPTHN